MCLTIRRGATSVCRRSTQAIRRARTIPSPKLPRRGKLGCPSPIRQRLNSSRSTRPTISRLSRTRSSHGEEVDCRRDQEAWVLQGRSQKGGYVYICLCAEEEARWRQNRSPCETGHHT